MSLAKSLSVLRTAGVVRPMSPVVLARIIKIVKAWGTGPAGGFSQLAVSRPDQPGIIDELGTLTFKQIHERTNSLAHGLKALGLKERDQVAIMCRNHRGFVESTVAAAKVGADLLYLNTAFAGPQLIEVIAREKPAMVIHDEEFTDLLAGADVKHRLISWQDSPQGDDNLEALIAAHPATDHEPVEHHARIVILTSGTTGTPKGAPRKEAGIANAVALLSRLPMKAGWRTHIAAPLFHTWGFAHMFLAMLLGSTLVLRRRFDPETTLRVVTDEQCDSLIVIPVMLQRILNLPDDVRAAYPLPSLKMTAASGSAMQGDMATVWMDQFGDNLYNIYGSTEVAYASVATPEDLRASPETAGKPPYATVVKALDNEGNPVPTGQTGRIFVGNAMLFEGYTGGGSKEMIDGLMATGDVGRFDEDGRLHVEGRDDEMIVSGGENVFPREVEDCLVRHDAVVEAAAVGVVDPEYGSRLRAFVVVSDPAAADETILKDWVRGNLARYKVPREIVFLEELPRNATGKILKRVLAETP